MLIQPGSRLGPYEIPSTIGADGEVYQAHDTKLSRHVAIKVLPQALAYDVDRLRAARCTTPRTVCRGR